jgi:hypothetical protein
MTLPDAMGGSWDAVVRTMQLLAGFACAIVAAEHAQMWRRGVIDAVWRPEVLAPWWGWRRVFMQSPLPRAVPWLQFVLAGVLVVGTMFAERAALSGALAAAGLAATVWLSALRVRGTMNGGSDGMLFTVLVGLACATWPSAPPRLAQGAMVFVAAQLLLSYVRAGLAKAAQRSWWSGEALGHFLAIPAYGVPAWVPRSSWLLRLVSPALVLFELAAPVVLLDLRACLIYSAVAWCFHLATAVIFGLNRFLLAWSAALPSVWFAVQLLHA